MPKRLEEREIFKTKLFIIKDVTLQFGKKKAKRELEEEIGYKASKSDKLGMFTMSPGYLTQKTHAFLTRGLAKGKRGGDEDEELELVENPFADFETLIKKGKISEARAIAALYMAKNFLENEKKKK